MKSISQAAAAEGSTRNAHLDFLRAIAIISVVLYHVVPMGPIQLPFVRQITDQGQYGVDLFFILSGWLIGGLYWREHAKFGRVNIRLFLLRRWIRTIPPYLVALLLAWLAAYASRKEPFDLGYLLFAQNYYRVIPFFLVSWSLCIEEHFYVFAALALSLAAQRRIATHLLLGSLVVMPCVFRCIESSDGLAGDFGYQRTATHFRLEGLAAGFWLSYCHYMCPLAWSRIKGASRLLLVPAVGFVLAMMFIPALVMYRFGILALSLSLAVFLVVAINRPPGPFVSHPWVRNIALSSYSVYLTHALMVHVGRQLSERVTWLPSIAYYPLTLLLIGVAGTIFYLFVEQPSLSIRDRLAPRRCA